MLTLGSHLQDKVSSFEAFTEKELALNVRVKFNPLQPGVAFLYPQKALENLKVSDVLRGYRKQHRAVMG